MRKKAWRANISTEDIDDGLSGGSLSAVPTEEVYKSKGLDRRFYTFVSDRSNLDVKFPGFSVFGIGFLQYKYLFEGRRITSEIMNISFCAPSSDFRYPPCKEVLRSADVNQIGLKPLVRVDNAAKKDIVPISSQEAGKSVVSSILMPGRPQGSIVGKKQLGEHGRKLEFVRTLLIDNYDSYTYNIYQELSVVNGLPPVVVQNDELTWKDVYRYVYEEKAFDNIVISPGPGSPTCPADIGICIQLLRECRDIPILGVCLGHQALGYAHGAKVVHAPEPVHGRLSEIEHNGCKLFHGIPSGPNSEFTVVRYHSLVLNEESLPKEVIPIAWTTSTDAVSFLGDNPDTNGNDRPQKGKVLMGIMHSSRPHYGVQFHPESVATRHGRQMFENFRVITQNYWQRSKPSLASQRCSPYAACAEIPYANGLLGEVPGSEQLVSYFDDEEYKEASISGQSMVDADNNSCFGMFNTGNLVRPNIGVEYVKLKWKKFDGLANKLGGAKNIFQDLYGHHEAENTFWLDSSSTEKGRARFSFMGGKGGSLWRHMTYRLSDQCDKISGGGYLTIEDAIGSTTTTFLEDGFFDFMKKDLLRFCYDEKDSEGLPFDFHGGYIGYIGYNLKVECGMVSNRHKSTTPDACFFFADNLIAVDHNNGDVYLLSVHEGNTNPSWMEATAEKLLNSEIQTSTDRTESRSRALRSSVPKLDFSCDKSRQGYVEDVEKCLEYIKDGESYELCLTTQLRKRIGDADPLGLYLHLREINPAPYAAWLNFSREKLSICCSSPERFLRLDKNGLLEAKPIKGTIARGTTVAEDELKKRHLQYSEKDQAENLMIVDLLRNDLGRVCEPGSVHVPRLMEVESYATVHTMVSTIQGKKREDVSAVDCVRAAFPGGSMTGAPKLRSMELLDAVETGARGVYSGCIGFLSYNQTFDLNIVIRTVVIHNGEASIGAGGAIVALSNPQDEYEEMILKTRAPVKAAAEFL